MVFFNIYRDQVVKRMGKVVKRKVSKPLTKQTGKKPASNKVITTTTTPLTSASLIYAVLGKGGESNSDESDFENSDDDEIDFKNNDDYNSDLQ